MSRETNMPEVEFEGPFGKFYLMEEVSLEALTKGISVIILELTRRGYREDVILEAIKAHYKDSDLPVKIAG